MFAQIEFKLLLILLFTILLTSCNSTTGSADNNQGVTRILTDSPINGVSYTCDGITKITKNGGEFNCQNTPVTFKIGSLELGTIMKTFPADNKIFPQDLAGVKRDNFTDNTVVKIARLLQSLDDDGTITSTIDISPDVADKFTDDGLNFDDDDALDTLAQIAGVSLVDENQAISHLRSNMYGVFIDLTNANSAATIDTPVTLTFTGAAVIDNTGKQINQMIIDSITKTATVFLINDPSNDQELVIITKADGYIDSGSSVILSKQQRIYEINLNLVSTQLNAPGIGIMVSEQDISGQMSTGMVNETLTITAQAGSPTVEVTIPPDTMFTDRQGNTVAATVLRVTNFDPTMPRALAAYPGGLNVVAQVDGLTIDGQSQTGEMPISFKSASFAAITITDGDGNKVRNFSQPIKVAMQFPQDIKDGEGEMVNIGDMVPIWSYDEDTGKWTYESEGEVVDSDTSDGLYDVVYSATHLSYYNLDWFYSTSCTSRFNLKDALDRADFTPYRFNLLVPDADIDETRQFNRGGFIAFQYIPAGFSGTLTVTTTAGTQITVNVDDFCDSTGGDKTTDITTRLAKPNIDAGNNRFISGDIGSTVTAQIATIQPAACEGTITYTSSNTSTATIQPSTDEISVVDSGTTTITASTTESDKCEAASDSYLLTVNLNPMVISPVAATVDEDDATSFNVNVSASDMGGALTWSLATNANFGTATVSGTGNTPTITYTPDTNYNGTDSFTALVVDNSGGRAEVVINIEINPVNDIPIFTSNGKTTATEDVLYSYSATATDIDGDDLYFSVINIPTWLGFSDVVLSGTPTNSDVGTHSVTIQVSDDVSTSQVSDVSTSIQQSFIITVNNTNDAPIITQGNSVTITMDEDATPTAFVAPTISATDEDIGDTLSWSLTTDATNGNAVVSGTGNTPTITYTPNTNYNGTDSFTLQVADNNGGIDTIIVNITINPVDDAPTISASPITGATVGTTYTFTLADAADIDGDSLSFEIQNKPSWANFNSDTGAFSGIPSSTGVFSNIIVSVVANGVKSSLPAFTITVSDTPASGAIWGQFMWNDGSTWQAQE